MERIVIGGAQFGSDYGVANQTGQISSNQFKLILERAKSLNINAIDTAMAYGNSETILGNIGISDWNIFTKLPGIPIGCTDIESWINESVQKSITNLKVGSLSGLLLHNPWQLIGRQGGLIYKVLTQLRDKGIVEKIGISIYSPTQLENIVDKYKFDIVQAPFNVIDRSLLMSGWLEYLNKRNIEIHIRSIFLQGLLLMNLNERPEKFKRWNSLWTRWEQWLNDRGLSSLEACLEYVFSFSNINRIIVGVDNIHHLDQIILIVSKGGAIAPPHHLISQDDDLINPSKWSSL